MYNYLISNRELIFAILIASIRAVFEGAILLFTIQTAVYQLSGKKISLINILIAGMLPKENRERERYEKPKRKYSSVYK